MFALSVAQPAASLLVLGLRTTEFRPWHTQYRGPLAIHAARAQRPLLLTAAELRALRGAGLDLADLPRGAVVGTVELTDCVRVEEYPAGAIPDAPAGGWVWQFARPARRETPWPARGRLGLFELTFPE